MKIGTKYLQDLWYHLGINWAFFQRHPTGNSTAPYWEFNRNIRIISDVRVFEKTPNYNDSDVRSFFDDSDVRVFEKIPYFLI